MVVDEEVNHPEERRPRRLMETRVFRYLIHFGKEIKRKRWVDQEVNRPGKRHLVVQKCLPATMLASRNLFAALFF